MLNLEEGDLITIEGTPGILVVRNAGFWPYKEKQKKAKKKPAGYTSLRSSKHYRHA